ncbi:MAG: hybrid sensor histidine kinase/response regulator [Rhodobacteraceae bacterium]|nr:hybrid sensor histidine kinase/response regulator [Paracoccaceae bacterium]MAY47956.1 hybrid sensor histidine kinase/response regulator [Paracoccaceae bacterium]QEW22548.1 Blue-light-activated protein [Marinibacterium anthonyi]
MDRTEHKTKALTTAGLNLIAQALSIYGSDLRLAVSNRRFQTMFDLPDALALPGARFDDTIRHLAETGEYGPVDDIESFVAIRVEQAQNFEPHYMERTRSNGRTISVEGAPLPQGGWVTVYTDITLVKETEALLRARSEELSERLLAHTEELSQTNRQLAATNAALEEAQRELREIEARTRLTTEMMPAHIAHVDRTGHYTYSNQRLTRILPGRPSTILGMHISDALGASAYGAIEPHLKQAFAGGDSVFEFTDGLSERRIRVAFTPDAFGGVYILSMDVTEETQARAALQQERRRATAAQLTSGLAHDFSNLLTVILAMQGKLERMDLPPEARRMVAATRSAALRGGRLLNRIADMTGRAAPRPEPTDLHQLFRDLKTLAEPTLPQGMGLSVVDMMPDTLVMLDAGRLQDGLLNLILNARDACGLNGQLAVSAHVAGDAWIEISVTDTGPGFSPEALEKAINPFFTTKGGEGSGLGLPMVYDTVKSAGGRLDLSNTPTGAKVTMRLPYRPAPDLPRGLVLLVEDNPDLRVSVREMLTGLGLSVIEANAVAEARALIASLPDIAFVLSDLRLAGEETGLDLACAARDSRARLIFMTSLPPDDPLHRDAAALAPVLSKPFAPAALATALIDEAAA